MCDPENYFGAIFVKPCRDLSEKMNFLKAAFFNEDGSSSLKNSEDLDNPDPEVADGWDNQDEEWSPVDEEIAADRAPEQGKNPSDAEKSGVSAGFWSLGGIVKSLTSKSEEVIESYRRDLEEFRTGLQKETEAIREVASRAVKDLPNSLDVGASVAQESLETVGQAIDEFGSSVWRGTTDILAEGKELISKLDEENANNNNNNDQGFGRAESSSSSAYSNVSFQGKYSRFETQIRAMQLDSNTYCQEPEDTEDFEAWKSEFRLEERKEEMEVLCRENAFMEEVKSRLVPNIVDYETFWTRYFYRLYKLKQAEEARVHLVKRAIISQEEEDLTWDVDDDEEETEVKEEQRTGEDKIVTESVEKLKIGEDSSEEPKSSEDLAAESDIVVESVDRSKIVKEVVEKSKAVEEVVEKLKAADEVVEKPKAAEEVVEKPKVADKLAEKTVTDENLLEKPEAVEIFADQIMVDEADESSQISKGEKVGDKTFMEVKTDPAESSKGSDFSVISSKPPSSQEEDDLGWDEIEDLSCVDEKKFTARGSPPDVRKRISIVQDDDEDLSWDVDDEDDVKN